MAAPRPGQWSAKPVPTRWSLRALPISFGAVQLLYYGIGIVSILLGAQTPRWATDLYFFAILGFVALWLVRLAWETAMRFKRAKDRALSDDAPGFEEHALEIVIVNHGATVGVDRGVAWFEDGLLHYSGAATSFVLAAGDVVPRRWLTLTNAYSDVPYDALRLHAEEDAYVRLRPLLGHRYRFRAALRRFLRAGVVSSKPRQWPPLEAYDS